MRYFLKFSEQMVPIFDQNGTIFASLIVQFEYKSLAMVANWKPAISFAILLKKFPRFDQENKSNSPVSKCLNKAPILSRPSKFAPFVQFLSNKTFQCSSSDLVQHFKRCQITSLKILL